MRIKFYKVDGSASTSVYPVDAEPFYRSSQWSVNPPVATDHPLPEPAVSERKQRLGELQSMDWRELKSLAEGYSIEKPEGGWDDAIPLILEAENRG